MNRDRNIYQSNDPQFHGLRRLDAALVRSRIAATLESDDQASFSLEELR